MLEIVKTEIQIEASLKKKIDFACNYAKVKENIIEGNLIKLIPTNIAYVEPHRLLVNNTSFLFFNTINKFYINDLTKAYEMDKLRDILIKTKNLDFS